MEFEEQLPRGLRDSQQQLSGLPVHRVPAELHCVRDSKAGVEQDQQECPHVYIDLVSEFKLADVQSHEQRLDLGVREGHCRRPVVLRHTELLRPVLRHHLVLDTEIAKGSQEGQLVTLRGGREISACAEEGQDGEKVFPERGVLSREIEKQSQESFIVLQRAFVDLPSLSVSKKDLRGPAERYGLLLLFRDDLFSAFDAFGPPHSSCPVAAKRLADPLSLDKTIALNRAGTLRKIPAAVFVPASGDVPASQF